MSKTKIELEAEIKELKSKLDTQIKVEQFDKAATDVRNIYNAFVRAGFTEEQAWEMVLIQMKGASTPKTTLF